MNVEEASAAVVDAAFHIYHDLGPGLLESVYETVLAHWLSGEGIQVERQKLVAFDYRDHHFEGGLRVDLLVENCLIVELKSVESFAPVHMKQLLTYLRLSHLPVGLLINFGAPTFKQAVKRVVNHHREVTSSLLRVNQL